MSALFACSALQRARTNLLGSKIHNSIEVSDIHDEIIKTRMKSNRIL